jgi:hypothetical protein
MSTSLSLSNRGIYGIPEAIQARSIRPYPMMVRDGMLGEKPFFAPPNKVLREPRD